MVGRPVRFLMVPVLLYFLKSPTQENLQGEIRSDIVRNIMLKCSLAQ